MPSGKITKIGLQATDCAGGSLSPAIGAAGPLSAIRSKARSPEAAARRRSSSQLRHHLRVIHDTVARWPAHKRVTGPACPSGNSSAS